MRDNPPLVPVTKTCLFPLVVNVHESVLLAEPVRVLGETEHDDVVLVVRLTTPAKELTALTEIEDIAVALTLVVRLVGLAVILKS